MSCAREGTPGTGPQVAFIWHKGMGTGAALTCSMPL